MAEITAPLHAPRAVATGGSASSRRTPELDGVRAIAIWAVLLTHCINTTEAALAGEQLHGIARYGYLLVAHGWLGVDLFFVLSGFLITGILLDSKHKPTYFRDFWTRRALRILPLVLAVIVVLAFVYRAYPLYFAMATFFTVDFARLFGVEGPRGMGPMWSLAVEEQFYLLWPFLVLVLNRRGLTLLALAIVVVEPLIRMASFNTLWEVPWCRSDGLAMGALAAIAVRTPAGITRRFPPLTIAGIAALFVIACDVVSHSAPASQALRISEADILFFLLIVGAYTYQGALLWWPLRSGFARFSAETSFCAYLVHAPLLDLFDKLVPAVNGPAAFHLVFVRAAVVIPITFAIAAVSRKYLEAPFLALGRKVAPDRAVAHPMRVAESTAVPS